MSLVPTPPLARTRDGRRAGLIGEAAGGGGGGGGRGGGGGVRGRRGNEVGETAEPEEGEEWGLDGYVGVEVPLGVLLVLPVGALL